jgi:hypothetical protein
VGVCEAEARRGVLFCEGVWVVVWCGLVAVACHCDDDVEAEDSWEGRVEGMKIQVEVSWLVVNRRVY